MFRSQAPRGSPAALSPPPSSGRPSRRRGPSRASFAVPDSDGNTTGPLLSAPLRPSLGLPSLDGAAENDRLNTAVREDVVHQDALCVDAFRTRRRRRFEQSLPDVAALPSQRRRRPSGVLPVASTLATGSVPFSMDSASFDTSARQDALRREIRMGKRPVLDDCCARPVYGASSAANVDPAQCSRMDSPDVASHSASTFWVPSSEAQFDFLAGHMSDHSDHSNDDSVPVPLPPPDANPLDYLSRVPPTPYVSACRASSNRRMRRDIRRHRLLLRAGFRPARVESPLPKDIITMLKRAWPSRSYYGGPQHICVYCSASFWFQEHCKSASREKHRPVYTGCCRCGNVSLPIYPNWPSPLSELLKFDGGPESNHFMRLIREYNSMFAFTSLGVHVDDTVNVGTGPYVFKICGVVCHQIGSLLPPSTNPEPKFAQLYIFDTLNELNNRMGIFNDGLADMDSSIRFSDSLLGRRRTRESHHGDNLDESTSRPSQRRRLHREEPDRAIVDSLRAMLDDHNPLVQTFRMAERRIFSPECPDVAIRLFGHEGTEHGNRYSLPAAPELAALITDDFSVEANRFDVIVQKNAGYFQRVSPLNPSLMALQYPLLFPYGSMGYHLGIKYRSADDIPVGGRKDVTMLEYYCYRLHYRKGEPNPFTCCGRLSNQITVDSYSCVESSRLTYHFLNQDTLRSETYQGLFDALGEGTDTGKNIGVEYILHSSYQ